MCKLSNLLASIFGFQGKFQGLTCSIYETWTEISDGCFSLSLSISVCVCVYTRECVYKKRWTKAKQANNNQIFPVSIFQI